jgi:hypothetical protein
LVILAILLTEGSGIKPNAVNFGVVAVQRFYGGKVVAVVMISMMRSGLIERR